MKGDNVWTPDPNGPHAAMAFVPDWPRERIASVIDDLMAAPPMTDVAAVDTGVLRAGCGWRSASSRR